MMTALSRHDDTLLCAAEAAHSAALVAYCAALDAQAACETRDSMRERGRTEHAMFLAHVELQRAQVVAAAIGAILDAECAE
jgi:hypothetical protein